MKIRSGFVSNSSSASFVLDIHVLSKKQVFEIADFLAKDETGEEWEVIFSENELKLKTSQYYISLKEFLSSIGADNSIIEFKCE